MVVAEVDDGDGVVGGTCRCGFLPVETSRHSSETGVRGGGNGRGRSKESDLGAALSCLAVLWFTCIQRFLSRFEKAYRFFNIFGKCHFGKNMVSVESCLP